MPLETNSEKTGDVTRFFASWISHIWYVILGGKASYTYVL